jgi:hypothetical protein
LETNRNAATTDGAIFKATVHNAAGDEIEVSRAI